MFANTQHLQKIITGIIAILFIFCGCKAYADEIDLLQPGHWYEVPSSQLETVFPSVWPPGNTGPRSVMDAWGGGAYDTSRDRLIIWGGGHSDYSGNEVYAFDLNTQSWSRLTDPSTDVGGDESTGLYPDGLPRSRHTYNNIVYAENVDRFMALGGYGTYPNGYGNHLVHAFDFGNLLWDNSRSPVPSNGTMLNAAAYDAITGNVWVLSSLGGGRLMEYNPLTDTWMSHTSVNLEIYGTSAIDTTRHNLLLVGGYGGNRQIYVYDLDNPDTAGQVPATSGATNLEYSGSIGLAYDPILDKYVGWQGGGDVYLLDPDTYVWTVVSPAADNTVVPTVANPTGTYGRFRYVPSRNVYIAVNRTNENVYIYRLSEQVGAVPSISFSVDTPTIQPQDTATLSWSATNADSCLASNGWGGDKATSGSELVGPLDVTTTFTLTCTNSNGSSSSDVVVTVATVSLPVITFSVDNDVIEPQQSVTLTWSANTADSCLASNGWSGDKPIAGSELVGPLDVTTTFTLTCTNIAGSSSSDVVVTVAAVSLPVISFSVDNDIIQQQQSVTLSWDASNADSCLASNGWSGDKPVSGSELVGPLDVTTTFTLTCTNAAGSDTSDVVVTVLQGSVPTISFFTDTPTIQPQDTATLNWDATDADSCSASNGWSGAKPVSGSELVGPLDVTTTFTLTCTNAAGSASGNVVVTVLSGAGLFDSLEPGFWYEIPNSQLETVFPAVFPPGNTGPQSVMDAWSGAAYDTLRDRFIVWGGGHSDYSGNEVYAFDLNTQTWSRLTDPSTDVGGDEPSGFYPDGLPRSVHTYNNLVYAETIDRFMALGNFATYPAGYANRLVHTFDFNSLTWDSTRAQVPPNGQMLNAAAYDAVTGNVWVLSSSGGGSLMEYNPLSDTWTTHASVSLEIYGTATIDTVRHNLLLVGGYGGQRQIFIFDLDNPGAGGQLPATSGVTDLEYSGAVGLTYDPVMDQYVGWKGGGDVFLLDPDTFEWTRVSPAAGNTVVPTSANPTGTFGRFRYIPSQNVFIAVNRTNENVYIYRLSNQTNGAPIISFSADNSVIEPQQTATLTWDAGNADSCSASDGWSGDKPVSGSEVVGPLDVTTTFTLTCTNAAGSTSSDVVVTVSLGNVPIINFSVDTPTINPQETVTLMWSTSGADSCVASNGWTGDKPTSGSELVGPLDITTTFTLTCTNAAGSMFSDVVVFVLADPNPGAVVSAFVHSRSGTAQSNIPVTFGQVFKAGDVPAGQTLGASLPNGDVIPLQVDVKATHADGSLRHAVLTAKLPSLGANATEQLILSTGGTPLSGSIDIATLLANGFDAEVQLNIGGEQYTASAAQMLTGGGFKTWLQGPLATEWIVGGPVKDINGVNHPHLAAYFHVRTYEGADRARVDVVIENGWTFVDNPTSFTYDVDILIAGTSVYTKAGLTQYHHTRWHKPLFWGAPVDAIVTHDGEYIQASRAVPNYLDGLNPSSSAFFGLVQSIEPMQNANLRTSFRDPGADQQIGPLPRWDALYLVSGDPRAYDSVLANDSAGGSYSVHYRDQVTGLPVSIADHPSVTIQDNSLPSPSGGNPLSHDQAHQPSIGFIAYMITGDYFYMEEMQFWATWNFLYANGGPGGYRQAELGIFGVEVRGQAWAMRQLGQTAYLTPDVHAHKQYYIDRVINNLAYNESLYPLNPDGNNLGVVMTYDAVDQFAPWMDDFYTWSMGYLVELGFDRANTMRNFKAIFPTGRMGLSPDEYCFNSAAPYHYTIGLSKAQTDVWPDFRTLYEENRPGEIGIVCNSQEMADYLTQTEGDTFVIGQIIGRAYLPDSYYANMQPALAIAVDAGVAAFDVQWARFWTDAPVRPDYNDYPVWAVVPRNTTISVPAITLSANPGEVNSGDTSLLSWNSPNADSCVASDGWTGSKAISGSEQVGPLSITTTFTLTCTNAAGSTADSVTVTVLSQPTSPPTVTFSANPTQVNSGETSLLTWDSPDADSCVASDGWSGSKAISGSEQVGPLSITTTFTLTCTNAAGSTADSVTVTVLSQPVDPPAVSITLPSTAFQGEKILLSWQSTNADSCVASGDWSGTVATLGEIEVGPLHGDATYNLSCTGPGGTTNASASVVVTTGRG